MVLCDNARTHTPEGSLLVRALLAKHGGNLVLVYTPKYDPEANRIEWLWRMSRKEVTHNHGRSEFKLLHADAKTHLRRLREQPQKCYARSAAPSPPTTIPPRHTTLPHDRLGCI